MDVYLNVDHVRYETQFNELLMYANLKNGIQIEYIQTF